MRNPSRTLFWMTLFLVIVIAICILIYIPLQTAFMANWVFNALILGVLIIGIFITYRQVLLLIPEIRWVTQFRTGRMGLSLQHEPNLLKPLARQLGEDTKRDKFKLSTLSLRTVLDGIRTRLDEQREITRYFISLLIFLGLLGTFWGLLGTINAVGQVIVNLDMQQDDFAIVFANLQQGLLEPLQGMGTAFSSSLLGLGGSLLLGFMDIQAGHAQNRFYDGLEEWLTGVTNLVESNSSDKIPDNLTDDWDYEITGIESLRELDRLREENAALNQQLRDRNPL